MQCPLVNSSNVSGKSSENHVERINSDEILTYLFTFFDVKTVTQAAVVSKRWRAVSYEKAVWRGMAYRILKQEFLEDPKKSSLVEEWIERCATIQRLFLSSSELNINEKKSLVAALHEVGHLYLWEDSTSERLKKAKKIYVRSLKIGTHPYLNFDFAFLLENQKKPNQKLAKKYYLKAGKGGCPEAYFNLGLKYAHGIGFKKNCIKAKKYYLKSARLKYGAAYLKLGNMYYWGTGVEASKKKAAHYYRKSGELGAGDGYNNLSILYEEGDGVKFNIEKANEYFQKALILGSKTAYINLGNMHYNGWGVKQDFKKAMECYLKAGDAENGAVYKLIGNMYQNGEGVDRDLEKANEYFRKAEELTP